MKKKILSMIMVSTMLVASLSGCGANKEQKAETQDATEVVTETVASTETEAILDTQEVLPEVEEEEVVIRVGAMSGPTAMSLVKLMSDAEAGQTANTYDFAELSTDASAFVAPIAKGELDIAAVPSNLAANLYAKTEGNVVVLATVNAGVLYAVENTEGEASVKAIESVADLAGRTIYMTGQGAVPEYTVRYLFSENGMNLDEDVQVIWCADTTEALAYISEVDQAVGILPQPFATAACAKTDWVKPVLDLNAEWDALGTGHSIVTGVIVARKDFVESHPNQIATFMEEYQKSVAYTTEDVEGAAALIEQYGIVAKAAIAQKALPNCHLTGDTGSTMKTNLEGFLQVLFEQNPQAVGGAMPGEDFYFGEN